MVPIGAHLDDADPVAASAALDADAVQFFLANPQGFKKPVPRDDAAAIRDSGLAVFIHAPYLVNVATLNNRIRIPSRKLLDQHAEAAASVGARGLIVHGGHLGEGDDPEAGFANWRKVFERTSFPVKILVENTAGGDNAMARSFDRLARLWELIGEYDVGFCLDTCHAHAAGEELLGIVDRVKAITGGIDLVHANGSRDEFGSGRDRHDNYATSKLDPELIAAVCREAAAPVILETPDDGHPDDIAYLRAALG